MTNKTQMAMFAIAAIAAMGIGLGPALAHVTTTNHVNNTDDNTTQTSSWDSIDCLYTTDNCQSKTKVYNNNPTDKVRVYYDVDNANCDVTVEWYDDNGNLDHSWERDNYSGTGASVTNFMPIDDGDEITTVVHYENCS